MVTSKLTQFVVFLLALLVVATTGFAVLTLKLMLSEGRATAGHQNMLERSIQERATVGTFFSSLQDAANAELRFLLTGEPALAEEYRAAAKRTSADLDLVSHDLEQNAAQHSKILRLQNLTREMLALLTHSVELREQSGFLTSENMERAKQTKLYMDQIQTIIAEMTAVGALHIEQMSSSVRRQSQKFQTLSFALFGGIIVSTLSGIGLWTYFIRLRERAERNLAAAKQKAEEARAEAEKANHAKTDFLAAMSHELRTPLAGIIGYSELLLDSPPEGDQQGYIERIQVASLSLLRVVDDILDFSRIEAGELRLDPQPFSITRLVDNVVSIVSSVAQKKGLPIKTALPPDLPQLVTGDEARLRQVLLNLLNNAVKFTKEGHVVLSVEHEKASGGGEQLRFVVTDTGIGIPTAKQDQLFRHFSQIDHSIRREFGGSGLGLAISKRLVELMGGQIGVESQEGRGSTFWFSLRIERAAELSPQPIDATVVAKPGRILVVEDLEQNQDLVRAILAAAGHHEVEVVSDGSEAIAAVQVQKFDLVLMDVQMPGVDGLTATHAIRGLDHPAKDVPIIAMTANVLPQQVASFKASGMNDHIGKPFRRAELISKIAEWLPMAPVDVIHSAALAGQSDVIEFSELRELLGPAWVEGGLRKLAEQLQDLRADSNSIEREELAAKAHRLLSHAAIFGFLGLSAAMSRVEEASRNGQDMQVELREAARAARAAEEVIMPFLKNCEAARWADQRHSPTDGRANLVGETA